MSAKRLKVIVTRRLPDPVAGALPAIDPTSPVAAFAVFLTLLAMILAVVWLAAGVIAHRRTRAS